jgi:hypothetical protein
MHKYSARLRTSGSDDVRRPDGQRLLLVLHRGVSNSALGRYLGPRRCGPSGGGKYSERRISTSTARLCCSRHDVWRVSSSSVARRVGPSRGVPCCCDELCGGRAPRVGVDLQAQVAGSSPSKVPPNVGRDFFSRLLEFFPPPASRLVGGSWACLLGFGAAWSGRVAAAGTSGRLGLAGLGLGCFQPRRALGPRQHGDYGRAPSVRCCTHR